MFCFFPQLMCVSFSFQNKMVSSQQGGHRLRGSWRMPNEEKERAADEPRNLRFVDVPHLQLSCPATCFFFRKNWNNPVIVQPGEFTSGSFTYIFSRIWLFLMMRCSVVSPCSQRKCSGRSGARRPCNKRRDWQCIYMSCFVKTSGIHHPKDIRFFETNQVQCIHMNLVHKVSLDTWRNTPTFGQSFPFTLKP